MIDHAIMMATVEYPADVLRGQVQDILQRGAEQLRDPERVLGLARKGTPGASVVEDVLITNSFGVQVDGEPYMGLFPELSVRPYSCPEERRETTKPALPETEPCLQSKVGATLP